MEEFFRGLDGRLRVSGMLADSIMMGIVYSAMENAHKKSCCSKQGHLVRLNEKSRFCELAIMQLEWCLKFLQEETQDNIIVESNCDREKLLSDLLATRDRIHNRLKETELMIAEKDRELSERMEIESNLRLALEVKDEDITSLNTALGLEREKRKRSKKSMEKIGILGIGEVDEQLCKIQAKLEDGQHNLKNLMRRISSRSFDFDKLIPEFDIGEAQVLFSSNVKDANSKLMLDGVQSLNLEIEFKEMAMDMDVLKEKIDSSFKTMASSVSLFKTILDEQRWVWNAERGTVNLIIKCFLREVQYKCSVDHGSPIDDVFSMPLDTNLVTFMDDIANLHEELEKLVPEINMVNLGDEDNTHKDKASLRNCLVSGPSKRNDDVHGEGDQKDSSMSGKADCTEDLSEESPSCRSVAQKIRTHEFIIHTKSQEFDSLKGEKSREKEYSNSTLRSERSLDSVKDMIARVNSSVESIIEERAKFIMHYDDLKCKVGREENPLQKKLSGFILGEGELEIVQSMRDIPEQSSSRPCCNLVQAELSEQINQLSQEKEDIDFKSILLEETYSIIFTGLVSRMHVEYIDCNIDTQIMDDIYKNTVREMIVEWSNNIDTHIMERMFMEETYHYVLSEVVKDISYALKLSVRNSYDEDLPVHNDQSQDYQVSTRYDTIQEPDALPNNFNLIDGSEIDFNSRPVESNIHLHLGQSEHDELNEQDDAFSSLNGRYGKEFQQQNSKVQFKEVKSSMVVPPDDEDGLNNQVTQVIGSIQDAKHSRCLLTRQEDSRLDELESIMVPLTEISKTIIDFEVIACAKIRTNMTRLEDLNHHVPFLIEQAISIKKQQSLYQKAFTRRCYDLQTAEAEVDLLGDEVDLLYSLVEKIYKVLNHYSPVLQHYFGIMDVLGLIKKQLHGEETCTTRLRKKSTLIEYITTP